MISETVGSNNPMWLGSTRKTCCTCSPFIHLSVYGQYQATRNNISSLLYDSFSNLLRSLRSPGRPPYKYNEYLERRYKTWQFSVSKFYAVISRSKLDNSSVKMHVRSSSTKGIHFKGMGDHGFMDSMDMTGPAHPELLGAPGITCDRCIGAGRFDCV